MSSCAFFSTAAVRRPVAGAEPADSPREIGVEKLPATSLLTAMPKLAGVTYASRLEARPAPEMVSSGIRQIDDLTGGLPRGCLTEVCGPVSSGRTSVLLATLAAATQRQEVCALVDVSDAFHPLSAVAAGVQFERLLWVRCGVPDKKWEGHDFSRAGETFLRTQALALEGKKRKFAEGPVEQALRVTDLLLQSGGFGLVMIDLGDVPLKIARRIPLTSWFRFQRAVEHTPTLLFVIAQAPCAQSCAALLLKVQATGKKPSAFSVQHSAENRNVLDSSVGGHGLSHAEATSQRSRALAPAVPTHAQLLDELHIEGELLRSRLERKPVRSVTEAFATTATRKG